MYKIAIIDDEEGMLHFLRKIFEMKNFKVFTFQTGDEGINFLKKNSVDTVILDVRLPDIDGSEVLKKVKLLIPDLPVIVITAYGDIESAVEFIKEGAYDYVTKPFPKEKILEIVRNSCEKYLLQQENKKLKKIIENNKFSPSDIIYKSQSMRDIIELAENVAPTDVTVLISGESGTGKELIAKLIHYKSNRNKKIFLPVNCSTFSETLFESHFFGHIKGSFTGAIKDQKGVLKEIDSGTIFLDEITEIPLKIQAKLLRLIQEKEFIPVGSHKIETADIRVIAATNKTLTEEVEKGNFRKDLFYRLSIISIHIPPLRERKEDIPELVNFFIKKYSIKFNKPVRGIEKNAIQALMEYNWPGNVRELENLIERSIILCKGDYLDSKLFAFLPFDTDIQSSNSEILPLETFVNNYIKKVYLLTGRNKIKTAELLKISRKTIDRKLKE